MKHHLLLPLIALVVFMTSLHTHADSDLVKDGKPLNVAQLPAPWQPTDGALVGDQMGQFLFGKAKLLEGDVTVRLRMSIDKFDGTATAFILDANNYVGFDSRSGAVFLEGPRFTQDKSLRIGKRDELIKEGEPFDFVLKRVNGILHFYINDQLLRKLDDPAKDFGTVGVRTHRAKIAIHDFSIEGNTSPLPENHDFKKPTVKFDVPDLTSLKPVPGVETVVVWESETDGYNTYRIPSVIKTQAGTLLAFCEGRVNSRSDTGDIDMLVKRSDDDGRSWSKHQVIWNNGPNTCGNPCPVIDQRTGDIVLVMTHNPGSEHERDIHAGTVAKGRTVWVCRSTDDGKTWTEPRNITVQTKAPDWRWYATGPGVGIQLTKGEHAGRLVIPCDHSQPISNGTVVNGSHAIYSDDGGETWAYGDPIQPGCNECQAVELSDGRLLMNARSAEEPKIRRISYSSDGGETWTAPKIENQLIEPRCQASLILFNTPDSSVKPWVVFSNPSHPFSRRNLVVRASADDGKTWTVAKTIEPGYAAYSCLVQIDNKTLGCLYEGSKPGRPYQWIAFARFDFDWLQSDESDEQQPQRVGSAE